jgi:hypothetical protein
VKVINPDHACAPIHQSSILSKRTITLQSPFLVINAEHGSIISIDPASISGAVNIDEGKI